MFSTINKSKWGDCSICSNRDCACVKVGKDLICTFCNNEKKAKKQIANATVKQRVRSLIKYERQEGILDSIQELILDLDRVVSRYVRLAAMGKDHKCQCFTCSVRKDWKKMQAGHFISRSHLGLRWDVVNNIRQQCPTCNVSLHGNIEAFKVNLESERKGITEWLYEKSKEVYSPTRDELKQQLFDFQQRLRLVEKKLTL